VAFCGILLGDWSCDLGYISQGQWRGGAHHNVNPLDSQVVIRRAERKDLTAICSIWMQGVRLAFGLPAPALEVAETYFADRITSLTSPFGIWVAETNGVVLGWQSLQQCRPNPISKMAEASTYISPNELRNGLGRKLLSFAQQRGIESRFRHIVAFIKTDNQSAILLYESLGWKRVGVLPYCAEQVDPECAYYAWPVPAGINATAS
jgi:L-amino acid N-acyltransferase YncA